MKVLQVLDAFQNEPHPNHQPGDETPEETFDLGEKLGESLQGGEVILLSGGLGAGKTLFTKGILYALDFDIDEVTSPSFTLVNLYKAKFDVYHIDFWRLDENSDVAFAVGLGEILEDETVIVIIEWSERLKKITKKFLQIMELPGKRSIFAHG